MDVTVACVEVGNYLGRGSEYVQKLKSMVDRNLSLPHDFFCIRASAKAGWWAKIDLFMPGRLEGRILYLDLDTVITGSLDELVQHKGLLHLGDWGWPTNDYGTGVMVWDAGEHSEVWTEYQAHIPLRFRGDQDYLTWLGGWDALPPHLNASYRYHAKDGPPEGAVTVSFHGRPKMHELPLEHWVHGYWR